MKEVRILAWTVKFAGNPLPVVGKKLNVGDKAPQFHAVGVDLADFDLASTSGKVRLISVVPSVDTPVCSLQTRHFNEDAAALGDVLILTVSCDLPFAQKKFCAAEGIEKVLMLSDHRDVDFGQKYGFLIEPLRLLARGIVVVDQQDRVAYVEYVDEVTDQVNFEAALEAAQKLL